MNFLRPLSLWAASSRISSSLHTAKRSQFSSSGAVFDVVNSDEGIATTPSSLMSQIARWKSLGRERTDSGKVKSFGTCTCQLF